LLTLGWLAPFATGVAALKLPFAALVLLALFITVLRRSLKVQVFEESCYEADTWTILLPLISSARWKANGGGWGWRLANRLLVE
jgi:hypothetical protein